MEDIAVKPAPGRKKSRKVPEELIYEIVDGKPIYYRGYRDVLSGKLNLEAVMSESSLQAWLKARLSYLLFAGLENKGYDILTGELGLILGPGARRGADISIYKTQNLTLDNHFATVPPELIIEIDIQADTEDISEMEYVLRKIDDYLRFGVKKVVWIFTANRKVMIATSTKPWLTQDWESPVDTLEGVTLNLELLLEGKTIR